MTLFSKLFILFCIFHFIVVTIEESDKRESLCDTRDGEKGVCINISTQLKYCPKLYSLLKTRDFEKLRQNVCSKDNTRVCCPTIMFNESLEYQPEPDYSQHKNFRLFPLKDCGQSFSADRILGGNKSSPGEIPFVVRIGVQSVAEDDPTTIQYICGGSLINQRYVLTAAHCFKHAHHKLAEIVLGQTDELKEDECIQTPDRDGKLVSVACAKPIRVGFEELIVHSGYTKEVGSENDIALIRLDRLINISSPFTRPICLPFLEEYHIKEKLDDGKILGLNTTMVAGWGKVNNIDSVGSSALQFVKVPIRPHILCRVSYRSFNVTETQLCAGGVRGMDSCLGDSGGPLYLPAIPGKQSPSRALRIFQLGVVSYGKTKCGKGNEPVVYTRVRSHLKWILDQIRD